MQSNYPPSQNNQQLSEFEQMNIQFFITAVQNNQFYEACASYMNLLKSSCYFDLRLLEIGQQQVNNNENQDQQKNPLPSQFLGLNEQLKRVNYQQMHDLNIQRWNMQQLQQQQQQELQQQLNLQQKQIQQQINQQQQQLHKSLESFKQISPNQGDIQISSNISDDSDGQVLRELDSTLFTIIDTSNTIPKQPNYQPRNHGELSQYDQKMVEELKRIKHVLF